MKTISGIVISLAMMFSVSAGPITTYTYTGNYFTFLPAPTSYTTTDRVTGSFTVATLADNLPDGSIDPISYSFSDGMQTLTQLNSDIVIFEVSTYPDGFILLWDIEVGIGNSMADEDYILTAGGQSSSTDIGSLDGTTFDEGTAIGSPPGIWNPGESPEPATAVYVVPALVGLAVISRRMRMSQCPS